MYNSYENVILYNTGKFCGRYVFKILDIMIRPWL